ncbi:MAG TPA: ABC transporter permease [Catalimonadaceae bacterium]|nr:ABC transporter permease [Catalimonadaceae bacterium]
MLVLKIAVRYLLALRKASTVQILSFLSFLGILLGSLAMVLVLSAFNGFEDLLKKVYHFQDPDLRIEKKHGKFFQIPQDKLDMISKSSQIQSSFEVLVDKASIQYGEGQMVVEIVGVDPGIVAVSRLDTSITDGAFVLKDKAGSGAVLSIGIKNALNVSLQNVFEFIRIHYPKRKKILKLGTSRIFNQLVVRPTGVVQMDENKVFLPIEEVRKLMDKPAGMNYLDIYVRKEGSVEQAQEEISKILGDEFLVKNENQQHADLYKVMMIEKLFVFLALGFIILISTFNLFVSSTMLVIDKKADFRIYSAMGLDPAQGAQVIRLTGGIITLSGLVIGVVIGAALVEIQKIFGFVPLGMSTTLIRSYPVELHFPDILAISVWVLISSVIALIIPGRRAEKMVQGVN